jgi:hypothetical protein
LGAEASISKDEAKNPPLGGKLAKLIADSICDDSCAEPCLLSNYLPRVALCAELINSKDGLREVIKETFDGDKQFSGNKIHGLVKG